MSYRQIAARSSTRIAIACALLTIAQTVRSEADSSPYRARVVVAGAAIQSGPGDNFYQTGTLNDGDAVEVYREKSGGWLAIRPPEGSYSLIADKDLEHQDGGLAEIVRDDVPSRIGSRLNERHNASQVRLKRGENVEVLGVEDINGEKWCKISPPAGEFRWIHASVVERSGDIPRSDQPPAPLPPTADAKVIKQTSGTSTAPTSPATDTLPPPLLPVSKPGDSTAPPTSPPVVSPTSPAKSTTSLASPATQPAAAANQSPAAQATGDLPHELAAIELRLSRMASAPTNLWNTEKLERDTAQLMARAKTQADRDAVKVTQDKISRFAQIGRRANQTPVILAQTGQGLSTTPTTPAAATPGGPYDAVGTLRPVVSRRPGAPQFALVDERGQVVSFITATPDLNLQPYLGRRIGVVGNRGFIPELQRANVTAARVTPLNDRMIR